MLYPDIKNIIKTNPGLHEALLAVSAFRHRKDRAFIYKTGKRANNPKHTHSTREENVQRVKKYIKLAREKGWRGSILKTLTASN